MPFLFIVLDISCMPELNKQALSLVTPQEYTYLPANCFVLVGPTRQSWIRTPQPLCHRENSNSQESHIHAGYVLVNPFPKGCVSMDE